MDLKSKLRARVALYEKIRRYFSDEGVTEVFTPQLSFSGNPDPAIQSFKTVSQSAGEHAMYLQTSPEFFMKRLLAEGSGSIFQICPAFRYGEAGQFHNPEFAMLEWYRLGFNYVELMDDVARLISSVTSSQPDIQQVTYSALFKPYGLNPHTDSLDKIQALARQKGIDVQSSITLSRDDWLDLLMTHVIEPSFNPDKLMFVSDFPASQASLAQIVESDDTDGDGYQVAQRFEVYWQGMELANGFSELRDAHEQLRRFEQDNQTRQRLELPEMPIDEKFLEALKQGLPECSGVALGLDRLLMIMTGSRDIADVLSFPFAEV